MRACWLKWVGRDWSISADYIWLNYSGANSELPKNKDGVDLVIELVAFLIARNPVWLNEVRGAACNRSKELEATGRYRMVTLCVRILLDLMASLNRLLNFFTWIRCSSSVIRGLLFIP